MTRDDRYQALYAKAAPEGAYLAEPADPPACLGFMAFGWDTYNDCPEYLLKTADTFPDLEVKAVAAITDGYAINKAIDLDTGDEFDVEVLVRFHPR